MFERSFVARWWRKRQRQIDRDILFPAIRAKAVTPATGTAAILMHVGVDDAWVRRREWEGREKIENDD